MSTLKEKLQNFKELSFTEKLEYIYRFLHCKLVQIYRTLFFNSLTMPIIYKSKDIELKKLEQDIDFEVDAVYMWVDGDDPKIIEKRNKHLKLEGKELNIQSANKGRFFDNEELKYSFRSLEKYAPWIRHIYLITDNQTPKWLKKHPKVTIVDHTDIMDKDILPTFNSEVIDYHIHKIKGLADHFILINDDMFFGRPVYKSLFFTKEGTPIKYLRKIARRKLYETSTGMFFDIYKKCQLMVEEKFNKEIPTTRFAHSITPYQKESFSKTIELFPEEVELTKTSRFRKEYDVSRFLVDFYEISQLEAEIVDLAKPWNAFTIDTDIRPDTWYKFKLIERRRPYMYCVNDNEHTTDEGRALCKEFLDEMAPEKSSFEK